MRMTSSDADILRRATIIIWDESTMASKDALKCVNKLLQDIMQNDKPFGGKTILLGGDFRQTLPVVAHGTRSAIVEASIKFTDLWSKFTILTLTSNVRSIDPEFTSWLIELGNGTLTNEHGLNENMFEVPAHMVCTGSIVSEIFGERLLARDAEEFANKAILCPTNADVDLINSQVLHLLEGEPRTYLSSDSIDDCTPDDENNYPVEFLHQLAPSVMPLHQLTIKVGAIIILLRNLNTKRGLCNGTRLVFRDLKPNLIIAELLSGSDKGRTLFIPRVDIAPTTTYLPFILRRRQFPVKLAFAMTINKSQGQTLDKVGIYLPQPVFSHRQLYVAFSRVRRSADVKVHVADGPKQGKLLHDSSTCYTKNVVYKEIFHI